LTFSTCSEREELPMRRLICWSALLLGLALLVPGGALGQKKNPDKKKKDYASEATKQDYTQLLQVKEAVGKIIALDPETREFTLEVEFQRLDPKPNAQTKLNQEQQKIQQRIAREQQRLARIRNPVQQMQEYQRFINQLQLDIARDTSLQKLFNIVTERKNFN